MIDPICTAFAIVDAAASVSIRSFALSQIDDPNVRPC